MHISEFDYYLPKSHIATYPTPERTDSRLLCLGREGGEIRHQRVSDLLTLLEPDDLLVLNDTKVIPARLFGKKATAGKVEILVERLLDEQRALVHMKASKSIRPETTITLEDNTVLTVLGRVDDLYEVAFPSGTSVLDTLNAIGHVPLPPYLDRPDEAEDHDRYQTVFARVPGAVAAPTAGLHFDEALLSAIQEQGVSIGYVTLHVGAGTFQPIRVDNIKQHVMHEEYVDVSSHLCEQVMETRARGGRVIAVGTTCVRSLESAVCEGALQPLSGNTRLFIYPGFKFQVIDGIMTNFHLPKSSLLLLISAFAGRDSVFNAYEEAIREGYRFYSYGDAMWIV